MIAIRLLAVLLLVGLNALFVAAEFSLVTVRQTRFRQLVAKGNARAKAVRQLTGELDRVLSGVQVGITLTSLGLGYIGEITFVQLLLPLFSWVPGRAGVLSAHGVALTLGFGAVTVMHVVLGELVPKSLSLQRSERVALLVALPLTWFLNVFRWPIRMLESAARICLRLLGAAAPNSLANVHSAEELQILVKQANERGLFGHEEERLIRSAMVLGRLQVREIMVPRPDVHSISADSTLDDVMRMFVTTQRSRLPVYEGSADHVLGYIHIKDIVWVLLDRERRTEVGWTAPEFDVRRILHPVLIVPESKPANEVLSELRARHSGIAMVVDEFGTILGLVTQEDILEQIVGEIHDEYDVVERPLIVGEGADTAMIFDASLSLRDLGTQYQISLPEDPAYATVGGFVLEQLGFIPRGGESFDYDGYRFTVVEMDRFRIARIKIQRMSPAMEALVPAPPAQPQPSPTDRRKDE